MIFGPPNEIEQKTLKIQCFEKICFRTRFLLSSSPHWLPKVKPTSTFFAYFLKMPICKSHAPVEAKSIFLRFRAFPKLQKIDAKTHSKKTLKTKNFQKSISTPILSSKTSQNRPKIAKKTSQKRL